ncbi:MAG: 6-phosphofructokinase, partial [Oscillospiraceae bacterium]
VIPGHIQRGGSPSAYDRVLATRFGVHAAYLVDKDIYGVSVAMRDGTVTANPLCEVAGKTKFIPQDDQIVQIARRMGVCMGD